MKTHSIGFLIAITRIAEVSFNSSNSAPAFVLLAQTRGAGYRGVQVAQFPFLLWNNAEGTELSQPVI